MTDLSKYLANRATENCMRELRLPPGLVDFCSNDYLGAARDLALHERIIERLKAVPSHGSTGARLVTGNSKLAESLEVKLAEFHNAPSALLFNSGYDANLGLISTLASRGDTVIYDEYSHASLRDGARLSSGRTYSFRHNDVADLKSKFENATGDVYIAVESIYSMDGDFAPLKELADFAREVGAFLIVDEAHSTGLFGNDGKGLVNELGLEEQVFARVHTFGKALGCHGAVVVGSELLKKYLINFARSFIYSTALPPHALIAIDECYDFVRSNSAAREKLFRNIAAFSEVCADVKGIQLQPGPIQVLLVPGNSEAKALAAAVQKGGFDVRAILSPTVVKGGERLRICVHAFNSEEEILSLMQVAKSFQ